MEDLRKQYTKHGLKKSDLSDCPFDQFSKWFDQAQLEISDPSFEPNAMALATANSRGVVSNRIVLLKGFDQNGFRFFTNYESKKAIDLSENPNAAILFFWPHLERQIRIEGCVTKTSRELSKKYFDSRPRKSRISAIVSPQSKPIENREVLETSSEKMITKLDDGPVDRPEYWGGYCLKPLLFEFWQGRENRLHDRLQYEWAESDWIVQRLGP